ncbi:cytochrome P450 736A117-like [Malania oleifera]|uniref:cytochrome P450 736A117-like n=1 Tax=Malania oleifera TaxID=397392 RepID=UPI0025AE8B63|nr:cytochrome P450 736A117-like [Malania oleifera]
MSQHFLLLLELEQQLKSYLIIPFFFSILSFFLALFLISKLRSSTSPTTQKRPPPSPPKLPVIGNLHQLGLDPHLSLRSLAECHGPLMLLRFGGMPVLVVSSAAAAREIMRTHDAVFSNRPETAIGRRLLYGRKDVVLAPHGEHWRQMRSISVLHLLNNKMVESFCSVRNEEVGFLVEKIKKASPSPVNLSEMFVSFTSDLICRAALGRKYIEGEEGARKFRELFREFVELFDGFNVGDYIPWLAWVNKVNGFDAKVEKVFREFDSFLNGVIEEHVDRQKSAGKDSGRAKEDDDGSRKDFVDVLLSIQRDKNSGFQIDSDGIKALVLDAFAGGTDTSFTTLEWAMSELIKHPRAMNQVQNEARRIASGKSYITDDGLDKMHYLKAVIKETLRLHPPAPLLVPRESTQDVKVNGYDISAGTMVITNAWAIGRDPASWEAPEEFRPERFLNSSVDFKGQDYELIPFGAGRRGCPGISFAVAAVGVALANLVYRFDWSLPGGVKGEDLDMTERSGVTIHRKFPLLAVATSK